MKRGRCARGESASTAKLRRDQIGEIKAMRAVGHSQQEIADAFGVHQGQISRILNGKAWAA